MTRFSDAVVFALATMAFGAVASTAQAQAAELPAEFPPISFEGNQYVDSEGCAFIRAGISGAVTWVPRMTRGREQLCGFEPTFAAASPEPVPVPLPEQVAEPEPIIAAAPVATPEPAPASAAPASAAVVAEAPAAPAPTLRVPRIAIGAPTTTVASVTTPPSIGPRAPAPVAAPAPVPAPAPAAAAPVALPTPMPIRQAEACSGLFGVQPNLINARTGEPIDCGPAPQLASAVGAAPAGMAAAPEPVRMTLSEVCARMAETGRTYIDQATGAPVSCPSAPVVLAAAPAPAIVAPAAVAPVAAPVTVATAAACPGVTYVGGTDRYPVRCGPQALSPSGVVNPATQGPRVMARAAAPALGQPSVPASNPVGAVPVVAAPIPGYQPAWEDGRVNPNRGVPRQAAGAVVSPPQPVARVSTRAVPQAVAPAPAATAHRYVQVGTYGEAANAQRAVARLQAMGLPVGTAQVSRNGQVLQIVAAGPFADAGSLQSALNAARSAGYSDAFTRR